MCNIVNNLLNNRFITAFLLSSQHCVQLCEKGFGLLNRSSKVGFRRPATTVDFSFCRGTNRGQQVPSAG